METYLAMLPVFQDFTAMERFRTRTARRRCSGEDVQTSVRIHTPQGRADVFGDAASVPGRWGGISFLLEINLGELRCKHRGFAHWSHRCDTARADGGPVHGQSNQKGANVVYDTAFNGLERSGHR